MQYQEKLSQFVSSKLMKIHLITIHFIHNFNTLSLSLPCITRISVFYSVGSRGGNNPRVVSGQKLTNNGSPNRKNTADLYAGGMQLLFLFF